MNPERRIILGSILLAVGVWVLDALLDAYVFGKSFVVPALLTDVSPHELYHRAFVCLLFVAFGWFVSRRVGVRERALAAARASEARFRRAVANAPFPMMLHAEDGEVVAMNAAWSEITGYCEEDIPTIDSWTEKAYGDRKPVVQEDIEQLYDLDRRVDEGEYVIRTASGEERVWDFSSAPLGRLADGRRVVLSMAADVTERRRMQDELEQGSHELGERVKELRCLYRAAQLVADRERSLGERLEEVVEILAVSWQWPDITTARVTLGSDVCEAGEGEGPVVAAQTAEIVVDDETIGSVEVRYHAERPEEDEGPFLSEERDLIEAVAGEISDMVRQQRVQAQVASLARFPAENPNPVMRVGADGTVEQANEAAIAVLETLGSGVEGRVPKGWQDTLNQAAVDGESRSLEVECDARTFLFSCAPVAEHNYINLYGLDVTERKVAQERIRHLNAVLRAIRNVNQLITEERDPERLLQGACERLVATRGYYSAWIAWLEEDGSFREAFEAGLGDEFAPVVETLERGEMPHCMGRALAGTGVVAFEDVADTCGSCALVSRHGQRGAMAVVLGHEQRVHGVLVVSVAEAMAGDEEEQSLLSEVAGDIALGLHGIETERRRAEAEQARRRSERRYRNLVDAMGEGLWVLDTAGVTTYVNEACAQMLGYSAEEMIGRSPGGFMDDENRDVFEEQLRGRREGLAERYELTFVGKDGREVHAVLSPRPVFSEEGEFEGAFAVLTDITELRRAQEELRALNAELEQRVEERTVELEAVNEELRAFAYSVSHDLRAPLRAMDGFGRILLEDYEESLDEQGQDYLRRVRAASQRMGDMIDDILQLSRVSRADMDREELDLSAMARAVADQLLEREPERDVEFCIEDGLREYGDRNLMRTVLQNLLGNAWKFTAGEAAARIEFGMTEVNGDAAYYVRDNGAGFDMEYSGKLFQAFERLHSREEFSGTGIGLATVQRIIRRHGGRVWAEGQPDEGATFYFTIGTASTSLIRRDDSENG